MASNEIGPAGFVRRAEQLLRLEELDIARRPVAPAGDPAEERRRIATERMATRIMWHATTEGAENAPAHEWIDVEATSKTAGAWAKGSGWYRLEDANDSEIRVLCHYRIAGDREDNPRSADPSGARSRAEEELWRRLRVEAADRYREAQELRAALVTAQATISTHLQTIAQKDARILALEESAVPQAEPPHWAAPVMEQLAGYLVEARPLAAPLLAELTPLVRAAAQEHLSAGAHSLALAGRLSAAQPAYKRLLDAVRDAPGFGLRLPEPTPDQVQAHHCPRPACGAERGEPCLDGEIQTDGHHHERIALARLPRELKSAIKKSGAELVPPGELTADDADVTEAARALCLILEMDAWQEAQDRAAVKALDVASSPETEAPPAATPAAPAPIVPPPPAPIPDAELEEEPEPGDAEAPPAPVSRALVQLTDAEARASFAAAARQRREEMDRAVARAKVKADAINAAKDAAKEPEQ